MPHFMTSEPRTKDLENFFRAGFEVREYPINIEKVFDLLQRPNSLSVQLKKFISSYLNEFSCKADKIWFPFNFIAPLFDAEVEESYHNLLSLFNDEDLEDRIEGSEDYLKFKSNLSIPHYRKSDGDPGEILENKISKNIIITISNYLGEPTEITTTVEENNFSFSYPKEQWEDIIDCIRKNRFSFKTGVQTETYVIWPQGYLIIYSGEDGRLYSCELNVKEVHQSLVSNALKNKGALNTYNNFTFGNLVSNYSLSTFNKETHKLPELIAEARKDSNKTSVLIQGDPGTGKTEWVKSYAYEVLSKEGFFTYFMDAYTIKQFSPDPNIPKVCIILNEVDNLIKDRGDYDDNNSGIREALLGFFDGSVYNSIIGSEDSNSKQEIIILLTCNTIVRMDPAFLRQGRVDLISKFTHKYVSDN